MGQAKQLYDLQEVDQELDRQHQALAEVEARLADEREVEAARTALEQARLRQHLKERELREAEAEMADLHHKLAPEERRLYSGRVTNLKELESLQLEVEALKEKHRHQEEKVLELMEQVELARHEVEGRGVELAGVEARRRVEVEQLSRQRTELLELISALDKKRATLAGRVEAGELRLYQELRRTRGSAVARVEQGRCQGCRLTLSLNEILKARAAIIQCSSCGRILYSE